ncbi:MAG: hypothetical protein DWQ45_06000 [Planctomycetota bacterium]|nr:MAG: hypothetical protein DWQ29_17940 [Planctomycetota bacterium]REK28022.1 MAG: hypothetical protein DWQ41_06315 [Planctomycetota bacterium]REK37549.1 MAG: hypothetical protein DWQ45_06000 [Planctomycetota bacterium]
MKGEPVRLDDSSKPPWFEPGIVCEVDESIYAHFHSTSFWKNDIAFASGARFGPLRLFWRNGDAYFGRELTPAETLRFIQLNLGDNIQEARSRITCRDTGRIRLACIHCDTGDYDGVNEIPADWVDVDEFQSYEQSLDEVTPDDPTRSPTEWYTHLGVCPECQRTHGR